MQTLEAVRIDKWLWAIRLYKTRALATAACRAGHVKIAGHPVKPARDVRINDLIEAKAGEMNRTVKVLGLIERRVGAQAVKEYAEDLTPASEYEKRREAILEPIFYRPKGPAGPPKRNADQWTKCSSCGLRCIRARSLSFLHCQRRSNQHRLKRVHFHSHQADVVHEFLTQSELPDLRQQFIKQFGQRELCPFAHGIHQHLLGVKFRWLPRPHTTHP